MSVTWGSFARLLVLFRLGPHRFALPAEHVVEICEAPEGAPTTGSFPHRGDALPLVDLRRRFRIEASMDPHVVLVARPPGSLGRVALLVDEVDAVIPCGTESMLEIPDPLHPFLGAYLDGLFVVRHEKTAEEGDLVAVLAPGALGIDAGENRNGRAGEPSLTGAHGSGLTLARVGHELVGLDLARVLAVLESPSITALPRVPACCEGITLWQGRAIPVYDLKKVLNLPSAKDDNIRRDSVVIVGRWRSSALGLRVDEVLGVLESGAPEPTGSVRPGIRGEAWLDGRRIFVLDPDAEYPGSPSAQDTPPRAA